VLDLGCGYGEFINNVHCWKRYGMDLNSRSQEYLEPDVTFLLQDCSASWSLPNESLDLVFTSNFFEHLPSKSALDQALTRTWRCLKPGGRVIAMGPNIRLVGGAYWDFWDHYLALTECSVAEAMRIRGFHIEKLVDRFLPYTMVNRRKMPSVLISLYLKAPFLWRVLGKQFLVIAKKPC
jgi:SAM-dependent methyltransferase